IETARTTSRIRNKCNRNCTVATRAEADSLRAIYRIDANRRVRRPLPEQFAVPVSYSSLRLMTICRSMAIRTAAPQTLFQAGVLNDVDNRQICHPDEQHMVPKSVAAILAG